MLIGLLLNSATKIRGEIFSMHKMLFCALGDNRSPTTPMVELVEFFVAEAVTIWYPSCFRYSRSRVWVEETVFLNTHNIYIATVGNGFKLMQSALMIDGTDIKSALN